MSPVEGIGRAIIGLPTYTFLQTPSKASRGEASAPSIGTERWGRPLVNHGVLGLALVTAYDLKLVISAAHNQSALRQPRTFVIRSALRFARKP